MNNLAHPKKSTKTPRRKSVNLTVRADIVEAAKALKVNTSRAAEAGIADAVKVAQEQAWLGEAKPALQAHNKRLDANGPLLTPDWAKEG